MKLPQVTHHCVYHEVPSTRAHIREPLCLGTKNSSASLGQLDCFHLGETMLLVIGHVPQVALTESKLRIKSAACFLYFNATC